MPGVRSAPAPEAEARSSPRELDRTESDPRREEPLPRRRDRPLARRQVARSSCGRRSVRPPSRTTAAPRRPSGRPQSGSSPTPRPATAAAPAARPTSARTGGMYASSSNTRPPTFTRGATSHQSRIGYGNPCAPSTSTRSSGRGSSPRQHLVREPDSEARPATRRSPAAQHSARKRASSSAEGVTASCTALARGEHQRRRAGPRLERRHPGPHLPLEPRERLPREPPVLRAARVQARRLAPQLVRQRPHAPIIAARGRNGRSSPASAARTARSSRSCCSTTATRSPASSGAPARATRTSTAIRERIDLVEADLNDQLALVRALRASRPHEVYNLASVSFVPASWEQPGAHRRARRRRRDRAARGDPRGRSRDSLLPGALERDLRRAARVAADRGDAALAADALRRREGVRALHRALVPPPLRPARLGRDPLQPRVAAAPAGVRPAQGCARCGRDLARPARASSGSATSTRDATGATRPTTCARCG